MSYHSLATYRLHTLLPGDYLDDVEALEPGWILTQLTQISRLDVDARLRKRYEVPFSEPYPEEVLAWTARIMDVRMLIRRRIDSQDPQFQFFVEQATTAKAELEETANGERALFEVKLRADTTASGISKGAPKSYSEASPYVWMSRQRLRGREEDSNGEGTSR